MRVVIERLSKTYRDRSGQTVEALQLIDLSVPRNRAIITDLMDRVDEVSGQIPKPPLFTRDHWAEGARHSSSSPLEFLEKLAALIPRSRVDLVL